MESYILWPNWNFISVTLLVIQRSWITWKLCVPLFNACLAWTSVNSSFTGYTACKRVQLTVRWYTGGEQRKPSFWGSFRRLKTQPHFTATGQQSRWRSLPAPREELAHAICSIATISCSEYTLGGWSFEFGEGDENLSPVVCVESPKGIHISWISGVIFPGK